MPLSVRTVDPVWHGRDEGDEEGRGGHAICLLPQLHECELGRAVDGDVEVKLAFGCLHFGDVDMEEADWVALEPLLCRLVALHLREAADPVTLQAPVQR